MRGWLQARHAERQRKHHEALLARTRPQEPDEPQEPELPEEAKEAQEPGRQEEQTSEALVVVSRRESEKLSEDQRRVLAERGEEYAQWLGAASKRVAADSGVKSAAAQDWGASLGDFGP